MWKPFHVQRSSLHSTGPTHSLVLHDIPYNCREIYTRTCKYFQCHLHRPRARCPMRSLCVAKDTRSTSFLRCKERSWLSTLGERRVFNGSSHEIYTLIIFELNQIYNQIIHNINYDFIRDEHIFSWYNIIGVAPISHYTHVHNKK